MRKLKYTIDLQLFRKIKKDIVPIIFTEHQFRLIEKRFTNKKMSDSEKNEFSRTISKKMNAINKIMEKETGNIFIYGEEKIKKDRLKLARSYIKKFSRKFKNKHITISGSFLYNDKYNDIDVFVVSTYEKERGTAHQSGRARSSYCRPPRTLCRRRAECRAQAARRTEDTGVSCFPRCVRYRPVLSGFSYTV